MKSISQGIFLAKAYLYPVMKQGLLLSLFVAALSAWAQPPNAPADDALPVLTLKRTSEEMVLDGVLAEAAWFQSPPARDFWQNFPADTSLAEGRTEIFMTYDEQFLYVGVKCHSLTRDYVIPSLRRDYSYFGNDNISILFDTFNDRTNAFLFGMNPYGVRREALISNGGRQFDDFAGSWDNKWYGEAQIHDGYWVAEFAIPFKTLRYREGSTQWRFNSYRFDTQTSEVSSWIRIPQNQVIMDLGFMGDMKWEEPLPKAGPNVSIIPYLSASGARDYDEPGASTNFLANAGGDAKVGITSGLNLDLTFNPDFSQVEVDQQVTNLDRFEVLFPERRQFFLENADLFNSFGISSRVNPFFSRRIGVSIDSETGQNFQNAIPFGARLSGKLNENLRVGLLNMQTARQRQAGLPQFNYTVATVQQRIMSRSNLSAIFSNKQAINPEGNDGTYNEHQRLVGLEYRIGDQRNRWQGKVFYHHLFTPVDTTVDNFAHGVQVEYLRKKYRVEWAHIYVGDGFDPEMGFVPRKDYLLVSPEAEIYTYPQQGPVSQHTIGFDYRMIYKPGNDGNTALPRWGLADRELELNWEMEFKNSARGNLSLGNTWVFLFNDFDPTRVQEDSLAILPAGSSYNYTFVGGQFRSDQRKTFFYTIEPNVGQFFNGFRAGLEGSFTFRYQPLGFLSLDYAYNHIRLEAPFKPTNLWLIGPRIDFTFSRNVFFTTFVQYNSQFENLNINARFQWRFQPVSDFFIVYTDNYLIDSFSQFAVRNRALVAKLTYWLNL